MGYDWDAGFGNKTSVIIDYTQNHISDKQILVCQHEVQYDYKCFIACFTCHVIPIWNK